MAWRYTKAALTRKYTTASPGIFPCHAGEYCGNHHPESDRRWGIIHSFEAYNDPGLQALERQWHREWLARMRFGLPHNCQAGDMRKMLAEGYVGLYLRESSPRTAWEPGDVELVPTPQHLMEPCLDRFYNVDGQFGIVKMSDAVIHGILFGNGSTTHGELDLGGVPKQIAEATRG